ncbi:MAG: hypothetical protein PHU30_06960 [Oscillospiraceae bacterium]|nr:hypothetical protein [Oscillospiraceae bacterium]
MELEQVYQQFLRFTGLDAEQGEEWMPLCEAAAAKLSGMLIPDTMEQTDSRLTLAAAADAYYQYALANSTADAKSIKIGDVSVSSQSGTGADSARALRDELFAGIASFLQPASGLRQVV